MHLLGVSGWKSLSHGITTEMVPTDLAQRLRGPYLRVTCRTTGSSRTHSSSYRFSVAKDLLRDARDKTRGEHVTVA
jgi:hypothetical protein